MPTALDLVDVTPDLGRGTWRVAIGDRAYTVREWTWGERRRLLAACVRDDDGAAALDGASFAQGVVQLLVAPPPPSDARDLLAAVALRLCGVVPGARPAPLLESEVRLARERGWGPAELDHQPAPRIDEQLRAPAGSGAGAADGWSGVIVIDDDA